VYLSFGFFFFGLPVSLSCYFGYLLLLLFLDVVYPVVSDVVCWFHLLVMFL